VSQAEQDKRIDYIEFAIDDIAAAKTFYAGVFGWEFTDYGPAYTSFFDGRLAGGFSTTPDASSGITGGGPLVVLYAADLAACEAAVKAHGGRIVKEPFEFPGGKRFHFADPSGHELAVWSEQ
jgi:predicted enzyme related to lactoylglutathione lyase